MRILDPRSAIRLHVSVGTVLVLAMAATVGQRRIRADDAAGEKAVAETEQWGPELCGLRTRLVPLQKEFILGEPMKFRLEMKNFGQREIPYDPQRLAVNGSTQVRDSEERLVPYIGGSFQTGISLPLPTLAPSKTTVLCDGLDLNSQHLIVRPGVYTVQSGKHCPEWLSLMRAHGIDEEKAQAMSSKEVRDQVKKFAADVEAAGGEFLPLELVVWEAIIPASKRVTIEVRPGTVPPERRVAARLLDILPKTWALNLRQFPPNDVTPPGWEAGRRDVFRRLRWLCWAL